MNAAAPATALGRRPLREEFVIARFEVGQHLGVRRLAVERTAEPSVYLLAADASTSADIIALMTVNAAGEIIDYKAECRYATDAEIADWVRRSGWKILTYLARRPPRDSMQIETREQPAVNLRSGQAELQERHVVQVRFADAQHFRGGDFLDDHLRDELDLCFE
jgi:hypothetical protein